MMESMIWWVLGEEGGLRGDKARWRRREGCACAHQEAEGPGLGDERGQGLEHLALCWCVGSGGSGSECVRVRVCRRGDGTGTQSQRTTHPTPHRYLLVGGVGARDDDVVEGGVRVQAEALADGLDAGGGWGVVGEAKGDGGRGERKTDRQADAPGRPEVALRVEVDDLACSCGVGGGGGCVLCGWGAKGG